MSDWSCPRCGAADPTPGGACSACGSPREQVADRTVVLSKIDPLMDAPGLDDNIIVTLDDIEPGTPILVVRGGDEEGRFFSLGGPRLILGRHEDADVVLDDITVSRRHCEITREVDGFHARDLGSLNGTYVNQKRVTVARLEQGDEVQVGKFRLVFLENPGIQQ